MNKYLHFSALLMMSILMNVPAGAVEKNHVRHGDFPGKPIKPWKLIALKNTPKPEIQVKGGVLKILMDKATPAPARRQLLQALPLLKSETKYLLSFDVMSEDVNSKLIVLLARSKDLEKGNYGLSQEVKLTKEWTTQKLFIVTRKLDPDNIPKLKFLLGKLKGDLSLRNVRVVEVKK